MRVCVCVCLLIVQQRISVSSFPRSKKEKENVLKKLLFQLHFVIFLLYMCTLGCVFGGLVGWLLCLIVCFKSHFYLYSCLNYWAQIIFCYSILCHGKSAWIVWWSKPDIIRKIYCFSFKVQMERRNTHWHRNALRKNFMKGM